MTQESGQIVFGVLLLFAGVLTALALYSSGVRRRREGPGGRHKNSVAEIVLTVAACSVLLLAFLLAKTYLYA